MKKILIVFFVMLSAFTYSQETCTAVRVEASLVDSLIMLPNVTKVDISSASFKEQFTHYSSIIFKVEENFLVVDDTLYFDLNKIIAFRKISKVLAKGDLVEFYFE
jgi:hypothetical protein